MEAALHHLTGLESLSAPQLTLARLPTGASSPLAALTRCRRLQLTPCADDLACLAGMATLEQLDLVLRVRDAAGANCLTVLGRLSRLTALQLTGSEDGCGNGGMAANGHDWCTDLDSVLQVRVGIETLSKAGTPLVRLTGHGICMWQRCSQREQWTTSVWRLSQPGHMLQWTSAQPQPAHITADLKRLCARRECTATTCRSSCSRVNTKLPCTSMQAISSCTSVVDLNIRCCSGLSDAGIRALAPLTRLRRLQISTEMVAQLPSFPTVLRQLPRLRCLNLQPASMVRRRQLGACAVVQ